MGRMPHPLAALYTVEHNVLVSGLHVRSLKICFQKKVLNYWVKRLCTVLNLRTDQADRAIGRGRLARCLDPTLAKLTLRIRKLFF